MVASTAKAKGPSKINVKKTRRSSKQVTFEVPGDAAHDLDVDDETEIDFCTRRATKEVPYDGCLDEDEGDAQSKTPFRIFREIDLKELPPPVARDDFNAAISSADFACPDPCDEILATTFDDDDIIVVVADEQ